MKYDVVEIGVDSLGEDKDGKIIRLSYWQVQWDELFTDAELKFFKECLIAVPARRHVEFHGPNAEKNARQWVKDYGK